MTSWFRDPRSFTVSQFHLLFAMLPLRLLHCYISNLLIPSVVTATPLHLHFAKLPCLTRSDAVTQWRSDICSLRSSIKIVIFILYYIYYYNNIYNIKIIVFFKSHTLISPNVTASLRHSVTAWCFTNETVKLWNCVSMFSPNGTVSQSHSLLLSRLASRCFAMTCVFVSNLSTKECTKWSPPCNEGGGGVAKRDVIDRMPARQWILQMVHYLYA